MITKKIQKVINEKIPSGVSKTQKTKLEICTDKKLSMGEHVPSNTYYVRGRK